MKTAGIIAEYNPFHKGHEYQIRYMKGAILIMGFIDTLKERAKANVKTIVLPETEDKRTLAATEKILKEGIAKVILVGNEEAVKKSAAEDGSKIVFTFAFALSLSVSINPMIKMAPFI